MRGPDVSDGCFRGRVPRLTDGWLRTGDLGVLYEGEVFVLGRLKDVVIVNGANHRPAGIEDTVRTAIGETAPHGAQRLVVAVELTSPGNVGLEPSVRQTIADHNGIRVHDVLPAWLRTHLAEFLDIPETGVDLAQYGVPLEHADVRDRS